ncbi:tripartite tricarboxylate transporter permease [Aquamicrobium terrae]|uniref:TctA family transporter n=1 Tax=Aquamicrobium terrae TaxID=1324945 RepID=A0ABV2N7C3_9HYPH
MELLHNLFYGFGVILDPVTLLYCLIGVTLGTLIGVLPGLGPVATISILLPMTYYLPPVPALIMLVGIYYGSQYGGSTTAILVNIPGESASVITCIDGHEMAKQGRAGAALGIAAFGSFIAGTFATFVIAIFAPPLGEFALDFGSPEYFSLMLLGLVAAVVLAHGSLIKAIAMVLIGLVLGIVGTDSNSGIARFTFGEIALTDGVDFAVAALGLFGFSEVMRNLEKSEKRETYSTRIHDLLPSRDDWKRSWKPILRGTALGSLFGTIPGAGATISSFAAYTLEKKLSHEPHNFGHGAIEGVAAPESANNAAAQTSIIPLLTLGIPGTATMAVMLGAMTIVGITPGPMVMVTNPDLFWGLIVSMWVGNLFLVILNLPLIGVWVKLLQVPYRLLYPLILLVAVVGIYSINNNHLDVMLAAGFGIAGYVLHKLGCELPPLILGFILGPLIEEHLRRAMLISRGDPSIFFTQPLSAAFLAVAALLILMIAIPNLRHIRDEAALEED